MILRHCNLSEKHSFFLFGLRGCGKTTLLEQTFSPQDSLWIDLLDRDTYDQFLLEPKRFEALIQAPEHRHKRVVVDEIQKLPELLDTVHSQIQKYKRQFVLTGSSSRRLKQQGTNLLAGRAWVFHLYPFTTAELGDGFDLKTALERGTLPEAALAENQQAAREYLNAYVGTYLEKEIQQERWVRNLAPFRKFLAIAAQINGKILNKSRIAREIGVNDITVASYFEIMETRFWVFSFPLFIAPCEKRKSRLPSFT